jgi:hypothetical protein
MTTEEAKAVGELAKTAGKALDIVRATGGWLGSIFGTLPEDLIGLGGADWLHEKRRRTIAQLQINTAKIIVNLPTSELTEPSPSVLLPLLQSAADEGRPELQALWAALLANALTDRGSRKVRRAFFETLAKMEPTDAVLLDVLASSKPDQNAVLDEASRRGISQDDFYLSLTALGELKCAHANMMITHYGKAFVAACSPPRPVAEPQDAS